MHEIVIVSGKGGTGKTSVTAAFADIASHALVCDLDVDAPDLHILLEPVPERGAVFMSGHEAVIDPAKCDGCGLCARMCRFGAIRADNGVYSVSPLHCEGCKVCVAFCPAGAVAFEDKHCGDWFVSYTRFGSMVHAQLLPGEENSGRLVALLKKEARALAKEEGHGLILCDGAPGIGCPVISSFSGASLAVVVTEPTPSGKHDLERVLDLCTHFNLRACVIINKCDLNAQVAAEIESLSRARGCEVVASLPHDAVFFEAMLQRRAITEMPDNVPAQTLRKAWSRIRTLAELGRVKKLAAMQS